MPVSLEAQVQHCRTIAFAYKVIRDHQDQLFKSFEVNASNDNERNSFARTRLRAYEHNDAKFKSSENVLKAFVDQLEEAEEAKRAQREQYQRDEEARRAWARQKRREDRKWEARRKQEEEEEEEEERKHERKTTDEEEYEEMEEKAEEDDDDEGDEGEDDDDTHPSYLRQDPRAEEERRQRSAEAERKRQQMWHDIMAETERDLRETNKRFGETHDRSSETSEQFRETNEKLEETTEQMSSHVKVSKYNPTIRDAEQQVNASPSNDTGAHDEKQQLKQEQARRRREALREEARNAKDDVDQEYERYQQPREPEAQSMIRRRHIKIALRLMQAPTKRQQQSPEPADIAASSVPGPRLDHFGYPCEVYNPRTVPNKRLSSEESSEESSDIPDDETEEAKAKCLRQAERRKLKLKVQFKAAGALFEVMEYHRWDSPSKLSKTKLDLSYPALIELSPSSDSITKTELGTSDSAPIELEMEQSCQDGTQDDATEQARPRPRPPIDFSTRACIIRYINPAPGESIKKGVRASLVSENEEWFGTIMPVEQKTSSAEGDLIDTTDPEVNAQTGGSARSAAYDLRGIL